MEPYRDTNRFSRIMGEVYIPEEIVELLELEEIDFLRIYGSQPALISVLGKLGRIIRRIEHKINALRKLVDETGLSSKLEFKKIPEEVSEDYCIGAIDSTYPPEGLELVGGRLSAIVAGYILYGCKNKKKDTVNIKNYNVIGDVLFYDVEELKDIVYTKAKILEKKVAQTLIDNKLQGLLDLDFLVFDGEIIPYKLLYKTPKSKQRNHRLQKLEEYTLKILKKAKEARISLIGVLKRAYSRALSVYVNTRIPVNDKAFMSIALRQGEYTCIGRLEQILPRMVKYMRVPREELRRKYMEAIEENLQQHPEYGEVQVCFYKPHNPTSFNQAVKLEILDYAKVGVENIIAYLASKTSENAVPYFIDIIDTMVRLEAQALEYVRRRLEAELAKRYERLGIILTGHTNPQKRYLTEPRT